MPDEPQLPPEPTSNYIVTSVTSLGHMSAYLMTKITQRQMENNVRLIQWGVPHCTVHVHMIAGVPSATIKGAIELKCLERYRPTDYVQAAAMIIDTNWNGYTSEKMSHDIDLIIERLRDVKLRRSSTSVPAPRETPLEGD